jgi:hypothetical protein
MISACANVETNIETQVVTRNTRTPSPTKTLIPSHTPRPPTNLPPISTFTPTFDVSTITTFTPEQKEICPKTNSDKNIELYKDQGYVPNTDEVFPPILDFLNEGGDANKLIEKANQVYWKGAGLLRDMTNDGVPEVIIKYPGLLIFTCQNDQYKLIFESGGTSSYKILDDLNKNGVPEVLINIGFSPAGVDINIEEWNGSEFSGIGQLGIDGGLQYEIVDWNKDGLQDFVFRGGASGPCCMDFAIPWRYKTRIYSWNGNEYLESYLFFDKAEYRFQAIQDGDREVLYGNYEIALNHYQDAISDSSLEWWTEERKDYEVKLFYDSYNPTPPTPLPYPLENPAEYPSLVSYAYYRIMLLQLLQGQETEANQTYQTLQNNFGNDIYAKPYIEMATEFLEAYQFNKNMYDGCAAAIQYAVVHPEILIPLGSDYHGSQAKIYKPEDVCPFR